MLTQALKRAAPVSVRTFGFKFPKHKELFAEDYYEPEQESGYDHSYPAGQDVHDYSKPTHRAT